MKLKDKIKFYGWQLVLCTGLILMLNMQPEDVAQQYWINISGIVMMYVGGMKLKKYLDLIDADSRDVWSDNTETIMNKETMVEKEKGACLFVRISKSIRALLRKLFETPALPSILIEVCDDRIDAMDRDVMDDYILQWLIAGYQVEEVAIKEQIPLEYIGRMCFMNEGIPEVPVMLRTQVESIERRTLIVENLDQAALEKQISITF